MKITSQDQIFFLRDNDVIRFESADGITIAHFVNGKRTIISETISEVEGQLKENSFINTDGNQLVNLNHISSISKGKDDFIVLDNGQKLAICGSRKETILEILNNHLNNL